jgi:biuret amidohydrolase
VKQAFGIDIPRTLEDVCDARRLALVVYDMQVGIRQQLPDGDAIVARVRQVLDVARAAGLRIFFMRHLSLPKELMGAFQYRTAMAWQRVGDPDEVAPWFLRDAPGLPWLQSSRRARARQSSTRSRCRPSKARRWASPCAIAA